MRHGEREDSANPAWLEAAQRPWDPPLSENGRTECSARGQALADTLSLRVERVFTSPFTRCVQTSALLMQQLGLPPERLTVVPQLCEWTSERNMNLRHAKRQALQISQNIESWFWEPSDPDAGLRGVLADALGVEASKQVRATASVLALRCAR